MSYIKKPKTKQIIPYYPKEEYRLDITELPKELIPSGGERYLLTIIDTFSKYATNYIQNLKKATLILGNLKNSIDINEAPKRIHTDNGGEFINKHMKNYLNSKGIQEVHGRPFNPRSQGVVEAYNCTIKTMLKKSIMMIQKKFDLNSILPNAVSAYIEKIRTSKLYAPKLLINCTEDNIIKKAKKILKNHKNI